MNRIDHRTLPDRFELEFQAHMHRNEVVGEAVHSATEWVESHVRDMVHRVTDVVTHHGQSAH
ncbi:MAG: hypothetical protein H6R02_1867 [Burkholderiaceae bacterium]|jgi:hypothetical protein|nr:hypothetical protein [Burkholderiaceae bacterium]